MFLFRHIIHIHIPAFPIAVARVCRPELRGRPVVVAPPLSERALIVSVSPEARKQGIFKG
ncbi:MAG: DNA polymerase IV, partial [Deltaproteobacteria bacterium]